MNFLVLLYSNTDPCNHYKVNKDKNQKKIWRCHLVKFIPIKEIESSISCFYRQIFSGTFGGGRQVDENKIFCPPRLISSTYSLNFQSSLRNFFASRMGVPPDKSAYIWTQPVIYTAYINLTFFMKQRIPWLAREVN